MTRHQFFAVALISTVFAGVLLVKGNLPSSKRKHSELPVPLSNPNSVSDQASVSDQTRISQVALDQKRTESTPATNSLLQTADVRWKQPIFEEPFAKFHDWAERYIAASAQEKPAAEAEGLELGRLRRSAMKNLIRENPRRALQLTLPVHVIRHLPASIQSQLEERVSGRGKLAVFGALPVAGKEKDFRATFRIATLGKSEYDAFVYGRRLGEPTRENIPMYGIALDRSMAVNENPVRILEPEEAATSKSADPICAVSGRSANEKNQRMAADIGGEIVFLCGAAHAVELNSKLLAQESGRSALSDDPTVAASSWTEGLKSLILIRVDFSDRPGAPLDDPTGIALISNVNAFYAEMSYGRAGIVAFGEGSDITPTFRLAQPAAWYGTNNNYNQLRAEARSAAAAAGYDLRAYDRDVICFGTVPNLNWAGLAFVGAAGVWLHNNFSTGVAAHELGHNLGLYHANFWDTSGQSVIGPGTNVEYGDSYDTMGLSGNSSKHFNVRNKAYLSWLKTNEWLNVTSNGTYRIFAHDTPEATGLRGLRVVKNSNTNYWIEFRQKIGNKWLMTGAGLRRAQNGNQQSQLLDATPGSPNGKNDSSIAIGKTFSDTTAGIHITPVAKGGTIPETLDVVVNLGFFTSNQPPLLHLNPSSAATAPKEMVSFSAVAQDFDGDALAYHWDFGDNNFGSNAPVVFKSWDSPGEYVVRCVVSDMKGGIASESRIITVGTPSTFRISGAVISSSGPLQGVRVYVSSTQMAYTDTDGTYSIVGLPAGSYTVRASLANYTITNLSFANPVVLGPSAGDVTFAANYSDPTAPLIVTQPLGQTVNIGANATFNVSAIGAARLYYQWRFNGASIAEATNSSYTRFNVQLSDTGNYSVVVTNATGSATSANAVLTVNPMPLLRTMLENLTFLPNGQPQFTISGIPNERYIVEFSSNLLDWVEGSTITNVTGIVQFTDTKTMNQPQRFYRSKLAK